MATDAKAVKPPAKEKKSKHANASQPLRTAWDKPQNVVFVMNRRQWMDLVNWIPTRFLSDQMAFVVFDQWDTIDDQFEKAVRDKMRTDARILSRTEEQSQKERISRLATCAVLNPQWNDPDMKVAGGTPLRHLAGELLTTFAALIVVGTNYDNKPADLLIEEAKKMNTNPIERTYMVPAPGANVCCITLRGPSVAYPRQSMSSKEPTALRGDGESLSGSSPPPPTPPAAAADAALGGRGAGRGAEK